MTHDSNNALNLCAIAILTVLLVGYIPIVSASVRPHYGGTIHVLLQHKITSLDPAVESEYPADRDKLSSLLFETLTEIDEQGEVQSKLAASWQADSAQRVWQFQLRPVNFQDGTAVTSTAVIASLKAVNADWKLSPNGKLSFSIETPSAMPNLPALLSLLRSAIVKRQAGVLVGTGPYKLAESQPADHAVFIANEDYWGGRPYADAIDIQMGASLREHLLERSLGRENIAEISIDQLRALEQTTQNIQLSRPSDLLVIVFPAAISDARLPARKAIDPKTRAALAAAINRNAISNVLLQRKSMPATALMPQWLTGYEFLFPDSANSEQARRLRAEAGGTAFLTLAYDASDSVLKLVADRLAVDARESGIGLQTYGDLHVNTRAGRKASTADAFLLRLPIRSLDAVAAMAALSEDLELPADMHAAILATAHTETLFQTERHVLEDFHIIPVAHVAEALWLNNSIHNWQQLPDGEWKIDQVWVEGRQ
jgi:MarR-like DNA-binding transcriptional regulator SgrR of sgrS sRNA